MKSRFGDPRSLIPMDELETCSYLRRNQDVALGSIPDLFFCMQYVGHYVCGKDFHIKRSLHKEGLILLTLSGQGKLIYRNAEYTLTRGSCMLID